MTTSPDGRQARRRSEMLQEIKDVALRQMAERGAASIGIREIAREMGVTPGALYRYVDGRDGLLTALIVDAYEETAALVEHAVADAGPGDIRSAWRQAAASLRSWAREHPQRWALIYGSPVPGYEAPPSTRAAGTRAPLALVHALAGWTAGADAAARRRWRAEEKRWSPELRTAAEERRTTVAAAAVPLALYVRGNVAWTTLIGLIGMDVFGQLGYGLGGHTDEVFAEEVDAIADRLLRS